MSGQIDEVCEILEYIADNNTVPRNIREAAGESSNLLKDEEFVEVATTDLLTVDFAKNVGANSMLRGLRMVSDFEYELQMATMNKCLNDEIETVFIMSSHEYSFLSSSSVKEIAKFGGDYSSFVPEVVHTALEKKINK